MGLSTSESNPPGQRAIEPSVYARSTQGIPLAGGYRRESVGEGLFNLAELRGTWLLAGSQRIKVGWICGWGTSIYSRGIAHFLGAWLPNYPSSGEGPGNGAYGLRSVYTNALETSPTGPERVLTGLEPNRSGAVGFSLEESQAPIAVAGLEMRQSSPMRRPVRTPKMPWCNRPGGRIATRPGLVLRNLR